MRAYGPRVSGSRQLSRALARIERLCAAAPDARGLRLDVVAELRRAVGFDAYAWLLTDPVTAVGTSPLADVPWLPELPQQIRLRYLTALNRWTALGDVGVALLHEATDGTPQRSLVWRELLSRYGVGDVASAVFGDRFGCWGFLELWRLGERGPFDRAEAELLEALVAPLTSALRRVQVPTFAAGAGHGPRRLGPAVLLLSPELSVRSHTSEAAPYLELLVPPAPERPPVPAAAYNVAAQLLAVEAGVDANPPWARVHVTDGFWVTVRASRIGDCGREDQRDIAVTLEPTPPRDRADVLARVCGLTTRERELLDHLVTGGDTRGIARRMFVSENTVQDHLKAVFDKTGCRTRRALITRAVGT